MGYSPFLEFIWLPTFERTAEGVLNQQDRREIELALLENPERGPSMPRTGGFRKMRWGAKGKGTRGGARIVYFYVPDRQTVYMVLVYTKAVKEDLTEGERAEFRKLARVIKQGRK